MLPNSLTTAGKSVLVAIGVGFGLIRGLRILDHITRNAHGMETVQARLDTLDLAVAQLSTQAEGFRARFDGAVTKEELTGTLDRIFEPLERNLELRFDRQARAVDALREMVGQTDRLLQRVLDGLESMNAERDVLNDVVSDMVDEMDETE